MGIGLGLAGLRLLVGEYLYGERKKGEKGERKIQEKKTAMA